MNASFLAADNALISQAPANPSYAVNAAFSATTSFTPCSDVSHAPKKASEVKGWSDSVKTVRICSGASCANVLEHDWPWKRCRTCKAGGTVQKMKHKGRDERPSLSNMGPPPPKQPNQLKRKISAPSPPVQHKHESILPTAAAFVHPDHLHVLQLPDTGALSSQWRSRPNHALLHLPLRPACIGAPHYGPNGEILTWLPVVVRGENREGDGPGHRAFEGHRGHVVAEPFVPPQSGRTPAESIVVSESSVPLPAEHVTVEGSRGVSTTPSEGDSTLNRVDPPPFKRKHTLPFLAPSRPKGRTCISSGCGRQIPANVKSEFCPDCGFILWRKQFRARVAGISASITSEPGSSEKPPNVSQDSCAEKGAASSSSRTSLRALLGEVMDVDEEDVPLALVVARKRSSVSAEQPTASPATPSSTTASEHSPAHPDVNNELVTPPTQPESRHITPPPTIPVPVALASPPQSANAADRKVTEVPPAPPAQGSIDPPAATSQQQLEVLPQPASSAVAPPTAASTPPVIEDGKGSDVHPHPSASSPSPPPTARPTLKIRIKIPKHLRRKRKNSLQRQLSWDSDLSDLTPLEDSTDEGESEVDSSMSGSEDEPLENRVGIVSRSQSHSNVDAPPSPLPSPPPIKHRGLCAAIGCANFLPDGSHWRICSKCRSADRKAKRHLKMRMPLAQEPDEEDEIKLPVNGDLTGYRKCVREWCDRMIPPEGQYRFKKCPSCLGELRSRTGVAIRRRRTSAADDDGDSAFLPSALAGTKHAKVAPESPISAKSPASPHDDIRLPNVPAYQHFAALLAAFHSRFGEFQVAQTHYLRFKAQQGDSTLGDSRRNRYPIVFRFDGEYSIVADPSRGVVDAVVQSVWQNVQAALRLSFTPVGVNAGPESSVVAILRCIYASQVSVPDALPSINISSASATPASESEVELRQESHQSIQIKMVGELQVCVAWDRRHKYFPGHRVLVRFRLVG
ncbi:hypothetical protein BN946_scf184402.g2 [Trametes cinnabarina]|uniref:Uncharacterized protein n=1 Tax=Pycnoporus cinnabarinus TaxID=5643 RepID=A0A060SRU3_PYCCI|nr:hypothetical protein BN946_scf184402.g2 [Trametes cinnabarina]